MFLKKKNKIRIKLLKDNNNNSFFLITMYDKYNYKQYILKKNILYTFFLIVNFIYKYGFLRNRNVYL